jgi:hypothetical protein
VEIFIGFVKKEGKIIIAAVGLRCVMAFQGFMSMLGITYLKQ